ncbi:MAG: hypothetical protein LBS58_02715 [Coriobacteriales bacterium]|jgi:hypothetical protein|nr:hypothetical protein [Coriobacteriales bacterium]
MENSIYLTLEDGTVIDDAYVDKTVLEFDEAIRNGKAKVVPNPHYYEPLRIKFAAMPKYIQRELQPFILHSK